MFFIDPGIHLILYDRFHNMKNRQPQSNVAQWPGITGITIGYCFSIEFRAVRVRSAQNHNNVFLSIFINSLKNTFLTFQVKGTRCGSDKALGLGTNGFSPGSPQTCRYGRTLNAVTFSNDNCFFSSQFHLEISFVF